MTDDDLVRGHAPLVIKQARAVARRSRGMVEADDLIGVGLMAVLAAARSFDEHRRVPFVVYASRSARWAMLSEARTSGRQRRGANDRQRMMQAAAAAIEQRTGAAASRGAVASELGVSTAVLDDWLREREAAAVVVLDDLDTPMAISDTTPDDVVIEDELCRCLERALAALPPRLFHIVRATFLDDRLLADVAAELGVSESRVSQLRGEAIVLLRDGLRLQLGDDVDLREPAADTHPVSPRRREQYRAALLDVCAGP